MGCGTKQCFFTLNSQLRSVIPGEKTSGRYEFQSLRSLDCVRIFGSADRKRRRLLDILYIFIHFVLFFIIFLFLLVYVFGGH